MSEAIQVPWTPQEALDCGVLTPERLGPSVTEPARSDTEGKTPLSMTATSTPWPWVTGQADGACTMSSTHISWSRTASAWAGSTVTAQSPAAARIGARKPGGRTHPAAAAGRSPARRAAAVR